MIIQEHCLMHNQNIKTAIKQYYVIKFPFDGVYASIFKLETWYMHTLHKQCVMSLLAGNDDNTLSFYSFCIIK